MFFKYGHFLLLLIAAINAANGLQCNYCSDDNCSKSKAYICDKNAVINTITVFNSAFMLEYQEPAITKKYECLSINTTFVDGANKNFDFAFKGCIVKGFDACRQTPNRMYHQREDRKHCKICKKDFCNKNSSTILKSCLGLMALVVLLLKVIHF